MCVYTLGMKTRCKGKSEKVKVAYAKKTHAGILESTSYGRESS